MTHEHKRSEAIDHVLTLLECLERKPIPNIDNRHKVDLATFQGLTVFKSQVTSGDQYDLLELMHGEDGEAIYCNPEVNPVTPDVIWPINISILGGIIKETTEQPEDNAISLQRFSSVSLKDMRSYRIYSKYNLHRSAALIDLETGHYETAVSLGSWNGQAWRTVSLQPSVKQSRYDKEHDDLHAKLAFSVALVLDYSWQVWIGFSNGPSLSFITDPTGVRESFRLRDLPAGQSRRAALRHWVTDHWRQKRYNQADKSYVIKHMRGKESFSWHGMTCTICPSPSDLREAQRARMHRKEDMEKSRIYRPYHQGF